MGKDVTEYTKKMASLGMTFEISLNHYNNKRYDAALSKLEVKDERDKLLKAQIVCQ